MRCEDAIEVIRAGETTASAELRAASAHAESCGDCRAALRALEAMREIRHEPEPTFDATAVERAIDRAFRESPQQRYRRGFWKGLASGAAIAATVATLAVGISLFRGAEDARAVPEVRIALNQRSNVTVTLETAEALADAEVRVQLRGAVALDGYAGQRELRWLTNLDRGVNQLTLPVSQRELRWLTNLDRGVNQLTLPVVASQASGGQVLVEVIHGDKRRTFVLDVRAG